MTRANRTGDSLVDGTLPLGWVVTELGKIVSPSKEKAEPGARRSDPYLSLEHIEANTTRIIGRGTGADVTSTKNLFRAGDVLYGKLRPYLNKVCIPDFAGICSTDILVFPKSEHISSRYLLRLLTRPEIVEFTNQHMAGVQLPRISFEKLAHFRIPLPPLAEQKRIVAQVDAVLARVSAARERVAGIPAILKRFRQSVLAAACDGRLTADWREHFRGLQVSEPTPPRRIATKRTRRGANLSGAEDLRLEPETPALPDSWRYMRADRLVAPDSVISYGIVLPGPEIPKGVPYVRQQDIEDGHIRLDQLRHTTKEIASKHGRSVLAGGDVLLCIIRNLRVAVVPFGVLDGANITQGAVRIRPNENLVTPDYLAAFLSSPVAQMWMKRRYFGMDMPRINVEDARAIPVAVPPREEQMEICRRVEQIFALTCSVEKRLAAAKTQADNLQSVVVSRAFAGELVATEAELARAEGRDYEPASVLLERIRSGAANADPPQGIPAKRTEGRRKDTIESARAKRRGRLRSLA